MPAIVKMNFTRHLDRAAKSVRYYAFRSRELADEKRGAFSRSSDHADVRKFIEGLRDPLTEDRFGKGGKVRQYAKMHRMVFSLSGDEFRKSGLSSWKPVVREALAEWERARGIRLEWIASEHMNPSSPHVHIAIKSVSSDLEGNRTRLKVNREMLLDLRQGVRRVVQRHRERYWREIEEQRLIERESRAAEQELRREVNRAVRHLLHDLERMARDDERQPDPIPRMRRRPRGREDRDRGGR